MQKIDTPSISFPSAELHNYRRLLADGGPIYTTRVSREVGRYRVGHVYASRLGELEVISCQQYRQLSQHPFLSELKSWQRDQINRHLDEHGFEVIGLVLAKKDGSAPLHA